MYAELESTAVSLVWSQRIKPEMIKVKNTYSIKGDVTEITLLNRGQEIITVIDTLDLPVVMPYSWHCNRGYARTQKRVGGRKRFIPMQRLLCGVADGEAPRLNPVDHINRNKLDNRRGNLRVATPKINNLNKNSINVRYRCNKWYGQVSQQHWGVFESRDEAVAFMADIKERMLRGEDVSSLRPVDRTVPTGPVASSGERYIHWKEKDNGYVVLGRKRKYLGFFKSLDEARAMRDAYLKECT